MSSKLIINRDILISNGYKTGPHFIGMHNDYWMYCNAHNGYAHHELLVKDRDNWKYCCHKCNNVVEYVD
jgi:hypothetical protein